MRADDVLSYDRRGGEAWVAPVHPLGSKSPLVASLARARAVGVVPPECEAVTPGQELAVVPLVG